MSTVVVNLNQFPSMSICSIARKMVAAGHHPDKLLHIRRGCTKVFTDDLPLSYWAARRVRESKNGAWMRLELDTL